MFFRANHAIHYLLIIQLFALFFCSAYSFASGMCFLVSGWRNVRTAYEINFYDLIFCDAGHLPVMAVINLICDPLALISLETHFMLS